MTGRLPLAAAALLAAGAAQAAKNTAPDSALDAYIQDAAKQDSQASGGTGGSIWSPNSQLASLIRDPRASQVNDLVTILIAERASAVAKGSTKSGRSSSAAHSIGALAGPTAAGGSLANLTSLSGSSSLAGEGSTTRETVLSTTISARVTHVLAGGLLAVEGAKTVQVNSEQQTVSVRGVVRPVDLSPDNVVTSDRISNLEVRINGKGVVGDAVRRPFFLYRVLMGLLPF